ncbi:dynamin family protein [Alkalihalophilus sp. As8PL]|uniref:Dynamin family protein n=1 Tax=Alkalihalophilus sp. As8PL TaxID=3237103 RepID=A0AB39BNV0_9BACI
MDYVKAKVALYEWVTELKESVGSLISNSLELEKIEELIEDIEQDYYTVVIVGEFKHGKSTFVNALLGEEIMPVDVTPTTATINTVFYSEEPQIQILKTNGEIETYEFSKDVLGQYTANSTTTLEDIKYIKMFMPSPLLKDRVVLVDTPGVNDLNSHRMEVTYQFIPRADAVLMMLDMTAPVKHTERKFIENQLLPRVNDRIVYLANFLDRVDEEEVDEVLDLMNRRISQTINGFCPEVLPISSLEGLEAKLAQDDELWEYSGLAKVQEKIENLIQNGSNSEAKLFRFNQRLQIIHHNIIAELESVKALQNDSIKGLKAQMAEMELFLDERKKVENQIQQYVNEREEEISFIILKSANYFGEQLRKDLQTKIDLFQGNDIKVLVESQLPLTIKSQFEQWVNQYSDYIHELLRKLEVELSKGLAKTFQQSIRLKNHFEHYSYASSTPLIESKTGNASVKAGLAVGGVSTLALLLGGPFLIPIVGMAGLPYLQQRIAEKQLESVKPELSIAIDGHLDLILNDFKFHLQQYISRSIHDIKQQTMAEFDQQLLQLKAKIDSAIQDKVQEQEIEQNVLNSMNELIAKIQEYIEKDVDSYERV